MEILNKRKHYVAALPLWLVQTLNEQNAPLSTAVNLADLASILSVDDVCFYYHYQTKFNFYTDDVFKDMENVVFSDSNFAWLTEHQEAVNKVGSSFDVAFNRNTKDITTNFVPSTIRKTAFTPVGHSNNVLLLVATDEGNDYDRNKFYSDCMGVLSAQIGAQSSEKFVVFERYTQS